MIKYGNVLIVLLIVSFWGAAKFRVAQSRSNPNQETKKLFLFAMSDYFPEEVLKDFFDKTGCRVQYDTFSSNEELLAKLQAGATGYDVIVPSDYIIPALIKGKFIQALDKTLLPNFKYVHSNFFGLDFDKTLSYVSPYTWGTTGLIVNKKFVKEKINSWNDVFSPQYKGRISLLDDEREALSAMLYILGHSPNSLDPKELKAAQQYLLNKKSLIRMFASDPKQHILSENVWIAHIYSGDAEQLVRDNPDLEYILPMEGVLGWVDSLAIPTGAPHPDCAHGFINHVLSPKEALAITHSLRYSSPNVSLEETEIDSHLKPSYMTHMPAKKVTFLMDLGSASAMWGQLWTEVKSY